MRLSWNEIRARAARFAEEWNDAHYERGESQTFYNEFFEVFGVTRRRVASFEEPVKKLGDERGFIDLFWKGVLLVEQQRAKIRTLAQIVFDARAQFPQSTLADLYDVDVMPPQLRKAHRKLDEAVDKLYRSTAFTGDRDRAEHLFGLYEKLVAPLVAAACQPARRVRR